MALADVLVASRLIPTTPVQTPAGVLPLRAVLVAIAGAEDSFDNKGGDRIGEHYTLPDGTSGTIPYSSWNCNGYTSLGPWQIHLPAHHDLVTRLAGSSVTDPCAMAQWLSDYSNSAKVAADIAGNGDGLTAWTTYTQGTWQKFIPQGLMAVGSPTTGGTPPTGDNPSPTQPIVANPIVNPPTPIGTSPFKLNPPKLIGVGLVLIGLGYALSR